MAIDSPLKGTASIEFVNGDAARHSDVKATHWAELRNGDHVRAPLQELAGQALSLVPNNDSGSLRKAERR